MDKGKDASMKMMLVTRSFIVPDMRASDETEKEKYIEGHPAVYNQRTNIGDWFYEVIERGAFDDCDFDDVLFFVNHDTRKIPLARSRRNNINSTMQIKLDETGLHSKARIDIEQNVEARSLYSAVSRGDIDGMSFMFWIAEERWENLNTDMPTRYITKISKVHEVSAVNVPAYKGTDIYARDQRSLDNGKIALENARSEVLDNTNNELELEKLKTQILMKG